MSRIGTKGTHISISMKRRVDVGEGTKEGGEGDKGEPENVGGDPEKRLEKRRIKNRAP